MEKELSSALVGLCIGFIIGLMISQFSIIELKEIINVLTTLLAAFLGAFFAFKYQNLTKHREEKEKNIAEGNRVLFVLGQRLNFLYNFQKNYIEPSRNDQVRMVNIIPIIDFHSPIDQIGFDKLNFLFNTGGVQVAFDLHLEDERYFATITSIKLRSELHYREAQPVMEKAGLKENTKVSETELKTIFGERLFKTLKYSTEDVISHVDLTIDSTEKVKNSLLAILNKLYPGYTFINVVRKSDNLTS